MGAEIRTIETFQYGRFEVRMKPSEASGMIYSFFTFYDEVDFATSWNEIDIEILGRYSNEVQFNAIVGNHQMSEKRYVLPFNPHEDFHDYAFTWTPQYIAWSVDGIEVYRLTGTNAVLKMNHPQKIMMNVWPSSSVAWAGTIDASKFPLEAAYDYVKYYAYQPTSKDTFKLKWTDNFDQLDVSRWQLATHTFDSNECVFTTDNAVVEEGILKLKLTKPADEEEAVVVPTQYIESASCIPNTSKKYAMYIPVKVQFYTPVNRIYCKPEFFTVSEGVVKHVYLDVDRTYIILYVDGLDIRKIKTQKVFYKPTTDGAEKLIQDVVIK